MASFGDLYNYSTKDGEITVLAEASTVKQVIEAAFREIFGHDISTDSTTPIGRFIEAITLFFVDVLGINAQNANQINPKYAVGQYLDAIGNLYGISRNGMVDSAYRETILASQSLGYGYEQSIRKALNNLGVNSCCILENGYDVPIVKPDAECGIALAPHSVFICVDKGTVTNAQIAEAVYKSKSAGCGYTTSSEYGTVVSEAYQDADTGSTSTVKFYEAQTKNATIVATVKAKGYVGSSITTDAANLLKNLVGAMSPASVLYTSEMAAELADNGIVATSIYVQDGVNQVSKVVVMPYQKISASSVTATITEAT